VRNEESEQCCKFIVRRPWTIERLLAEPYGVSTRCNSSKVKAYRYHASFPTGDGRMRFLGCFATADAAKKAWDLEARRLGWNIVNEPQSGEASIQSVIQGRFAELRSSGFPYPPSALNWRREELEVVLAEDPGAIWQSDDVLQLGDHERAPGVQLCWSFHPHSFSVSKTKKMGNDGHLELKPSPLDTFNSDIGLLKCLRTSIERHGDLDGSSITIRGECKYHDTSAFLKGGGSWITNFQPLVAAAIYARYGGSGGVVYDSSAGWGGRLLGARLAGVQKYIACEPCEATFCGLSELSRLVSGPIDVELHKCGSEDFQLNETVDLAFTSPPYFNTEHYSSEPTQSFKRFPLAKQWCVGFLRPTIAHTWSAIRPGGYMVISIAGRRMHRRAGLDMEVEVKLAAKQVGAQLEKVLSLCKPDQSLETAQPIFVFRKGPSLSSSSTADPT